MQIAKLPKKYESIWNKCLPLFEHGRTGDAQHAAETVQFILEYKGGLKLDFDIFIPLAMMHDIGHAAILPEHIKLVTGPEKLPNGKLVHMLTGAKMARDILRDVNYGAETSDEIVDIISMHDNNLLEYGASRDDYNTENKRIFHDIDSLDRYSEKRMRSFEQMYSRDVFLKKVEELLPLFFYDDFRSIAEDRLSTLRNS